jgi:crotonobetainyl-CoA:carnitine CoA-transferase CaiB-like acyl-CoA transferase
MSKSYPAGSHQEMLFEVANDDWVHMSIMSGLPPIRSQDDILGVGVEASDNERYAMLSEEERAQITPLRKAAYLRQQRDELIDAFRENNHAMEAIVPMGDALGGGPAHEPHPQLVANDMIATVEDPELGTTTQVGVPIHLQGTPGAIRGPRPTPGQHNEEILGELGYSPEDLKAFT